MPDWLIYAIIFLPLGFGLGAATLHMRCQSQKFARDADDFLKASSGNAQ